MTPKPHYSRSMKTKRLHEAGTLSVDAASQKIRVLLISEGSGSSSDYEREFFTQENADSLAGSLSFPGHPKDLTKPEHRDPMTAIGTISESVTVEEHEGKMGFWSEYVPATSRPDVGAYLAEFGAKLGLSVYADSTGREDPVTGKYIAESIAVEDPYRSVDLVVASGARGKFERVAEGLRRITEASASAGEEEVTKMDKDIEERFDGLKKIIEGLADTLEGKHKNASQVEADTAAVEKIVEGRFSDYDKAVTLIDGAKLTESQNTSLRALAKEGVDVAPHVEAAKKILVEARAGFDANDDTHLGGGDAKISFDPTVDGFGKVS